MSRVTPSMGFVTRYWCAIGMTGTVRPTMRPISCDQIPPALTTTSHGTVPWSVCTAVILRPPTSMPSTFTPVRIVTPRFRAPAASAPASDAGSMRPSVGR